MAKIYEKQAEFAKKRRFPFWDARRINRHLLKCQKKIFEMRGILSRMKDTPGAEEHLQKVRNAIDVLYAEIEKYKVD